MQQCAKRESTLSPRFDDALAYASQLHRDQFRKGGCIPYVSHLLAVTAIVLEHGGTEDESIAALLHDAVEDQGGAATREAISNRFGEAVARIVDGCSDAETIPKPPWKERKEAYIAHVANTSSSVRLVSAADKLHNVRAIITDYQRSGEFLWDRFKGGRCGTLWYYRALADAFRAIERAPLIEELDRTVTALEILVAIPPADQKRIRDLLLTQRWIFAKTMPDNPHWYTLRKNWQGDEDFAWTVEMIRRYGYEEIYEGRPYTVLNVDDWKYWTMGASVSETILINRKKLTPFDDL